MGEVSQKEQEMTFTQKYLRLSGDMEHHRLLIVLNGMTFWVGCTYAE